MRLRKALKKIAATASLCRAEPEVMSCPVELSEEERAWFDRIAEQNTAALEQLLARPESDISFRVVFKDPPDA